MNLQQKTYEKLNTKETLPSTPFQYIWYMTKMYKWWAIGAVSVVIIASALSQATNYFLKLIVDTVEKGQPELVIYYALAYPVTVFIVQMLYRLSGYLTRVWVIGSRKVGYDKLTDYTLKHSDSYFADRFAGSLMSKIGNVVDAVDDVITTTLWMHINALVAFLITFSFIISVDLWAGMVFVTLIMFLITMNRFFGGRKTRLSKENSEAKTEVRGRIVDTFSNIQAVRQYARFKEEKMRVGQATNKLTQTSHNNWGYTEYMLFWNTFVLFIFSMILFWLLVKTWQAGEMGTGDFILIISLYAQITGTLIFIGRAFESTARSIGEIKEGLGDIMLPHEVVDIPGANLLKVSGGKIDWQDVTFTYEKESVFKNLSLKITPGQRIGLVGPSGAGKSTFVSLLLRQHNINSGKIEIDDQNINFVTQNSLRKQIALVPQEPALFHRSIKDNIAYGNPDANIESIQEVAKKAYAHDFIVGLPDGYDTLVGERGVKLSGGQRQRIAIARALLKNAPILVLDEATSALDSESEVVIQKALHKLMEGKTVIAIAHRLSTLREMDRIIVFDKGNIVEDGTHEELKYSGGLYQKLWEHQSDGFLQE